VRKFAWLAATLATFAAAAWGDPSEAADKVDEGLERYRAGAFADAAQAFADAQTALPGDPRIAFDRGCALAAQGELDAAIAPLHEAALARDPDLAARARFNLGTTGIAAAKKAFGEKPEAAAPDARKNGLEHLGRAVAHFRDLVRQPGVPEPIAADARHNLELVRLWIKHMVALWAEHDRQKQRQETSLVEFLELLRRRQVALRAVGRALEAEEDSPRRREAVSATAREQRKLGEEIEPLKAKIAGELQAAGAEAVKLLGDRADEAGTAMAAAAERLEAGALRAAREPQTRAATIFDAILAAVVTFPDLVKKGVETQAALVGVTAPLAETPDAAEAASFEDLAEEQGRLERWAHILPRKAEEAKQAAAGFDPSKSAGGPDPEAAKKQMEALAKAADKAIELAPRIASLSKDAVAGLAARKPAEALPKEEAALKLWREIAELLPKQEQQGEDQKKDQEKKDEEKKEDQQKKDPKKEGEKQPEKKEEPKPDPGQQGKEKPPMTKEQAEALLRKARERERKHKEDLKELMEAILAPGGVEKDW